MAKKKADVTRYVNYYRCSSDDQAHGDFTTIDTQKEIDARHVETVGGVLIGEYNDEGKTGTNLKRNGWRQMLADAQAKKFDKVCITYMSRLGRGDAYVIAEHELGKFGVEVEMVKESFSDDLAGYMGKSMTIMMDGMYPKMVSGWTKTKQAEMVKKGYFCGGLIPFGYVTMDVEGTSVKEGKSPPKRLVPHPDLGTVATRAFDMALAREGMAVIRDYLSSTSPRKWTITAVKNMLTNEVYKGVLRYGPNRNEAAHEALVTPETWAAVQAVTGQSKGREARGVDDYRYLLHGKLTCPHCGCRYTQFSSNGNARCHYYGCSYSNKHKSDCPVKLVNADAVHLTIISLLDRAAKHHSVMQSLIAGSQSWSRPPELLKFKRKHLLAKRKEVMRQITGLLSAIAGGMTNPSISLRLAELEGEKAKVASDILEVEAQIEETTIVRPRTEDVMACWREMLAGWEELTDPEREEVLQAIVEEVVVTQKDRVHLRLLPFASVHGQLIALNTPLRAGSATNTTFNPGFYDAPVYIPAGGKNRTKIPRPERQARAA